MKKILIVFGTRPEAIKMAPVIKQLNKFPEIFEIKICVTAQHREMLDQVLEIFDIKPDYDLNLMKSNQDLFDITSRVLLKMREVLDEFKPELVLVHGDTTTSAITALAAFYRQIPVGHVEAGLRSGNIYSPWPEEMNRKITGSIAGLHFAPTENAKNNLIKENVHQEQIYVTGNTVIDALQIAIHKIEKSPELETALISELSVFFDKDLKSIINSGIILVTGHRRENFGEGFIRICRALKKIAEIYPDIHIIYPVHLNPNVRETVFKLLGKVTNICLLPPLSYLQFIYLLKHSHIVLTDSGGIQEEAPSLGKPVLVMRDTTERPEAVVAGTVKLVGTNYKIILDEVRLLLDDSEAYELMSKSINPYGDGKAALRIVNILKSINC